jgi:shikimate kinase
VSDPLTDDLPSPTVVLTGFMGTGKSTVARLVAEHLGLDHVDTDTLIEERHGPIERIFATRGEEAFRTLEREVASELAGRTGLVVSTGGAMMLDPTNRATLGAGATLVCLVASAAEISRRVQADDVERPLLAGPNSIARISELLTERESTYARFTQIETEGRSPEEIAADIVAIAVSSG